MPDGNAERSSAKYSLKLEHGKLTGDGRFSGKRTRSAEIQTQNANQVDLFGTETYEVDYYDTLPY